MMDLIDNILEHIDSNCFSDTELFNLIEGTKNKRYGVIKRAIQRGDLIHVCRGLYCLAKRYRKKPLNLFEVAQRIYGPSYISLESALSHHGWIPESVPVIVSAASRRSKIFQTPLGIFEYNRVVCRPFFCGVVLESGEGSPYYLAKPLKALCDYVYSHKKDWQSLRPLIHSLRIEEGQLRNVKKSDFKELGTAYRSKRILRFLKNVKEDLEK